MARPPLEKAKKQYIHRFTMEHVPQWALELRPDGTHYAPQYRSDREWYDNTVFPGEAGHYGPKTSCITSNQTWPLGMSLAATFQRKA